MSAPDLRRYLAEVRARCEAATPGPWEWCAQSDDHIGIMQQKNSLSEVIGAIGNDCEQWAVVDPVDADFIAQARTDVPRLLELAEKLLAAVEYAALEVCHRGWSDGCEGHVLPGEALCATCGCRAILSECAEIVGRR